MQVYMNGRYIDHTDATVSVDDRGFLFADGVYEVIRVYRGEPFLLQPHLHRLRAGLDALRIDNTHLPDVGDVARRLIAGNDVTGDGIVYIQVTRGAAPRAHAFPPDGVRPTVYAFARAFKQYPPTHFTQGVPAITTPDTRWSRCDIKSIALLPNVLANQAAHEAGAFEAILVRDGVLIEGSHSNLFGVIDGTLMTYPASNYILAGITRALVLEIARELDIPTREAPLLWDRRPDVDEMFLSGTTTEIMPLASLDGVPIGNGRPGRITTMLIHAFRARVNELTDPVANAV